MFVEFTPTRRSSIKYVHPDFVILDPLPPCTCTCAFSLHPSPQDERTDFIFEVRYDRDILYELLSIKEPERTIQNKETIVQSYWKMSDQNTKKIPGSRLRFLTVWERWEWIIFAVWIAHFHYFVLKFVMNLQKKLRLTYAYRWTFPLRHTSQYAFNWNTPSLLRGYALYGWPQVSIGAIDRG